MESSTTKNDDGSKTVVDYLYDTIDGIFTCTAEISTFYDSDGIKFDQRKTIHDFLSPSQSFSRVDDSDGSFLGSNVGSHLPGFYSKKISRFNPSEESEEKTLSGKPLINTTFPVVDDDSLAYITDEINWLDRKTQETISLTLFSYPHLIDFNDRIIFQGREYFLVSNSAGTTENIFNRQDLKLVRWF